jgi:hypothetical protein
MRQAVAAIVSVRMPPTRRKARIGFVLPKLHSLVDFGTRPSTAGGRELNTTAAWLTWLRHVGLKPSPSSGAAFVAAPRSRRPVLEPVRGQHARLSLRAKERPTHRPLFFLASRTPIPAISSSVMNRIPAFSNAASSRITVET